MTDIKDIASNFKFLGISVDTEILNKCFQLCSAYSLSAEDFVDQWCAFSASYLNGELPTVDSLNNLERKELIKRNREPSNFSAVETANRICKGSIADVSQEADVNPYCERTVKSGSSTKHLQLSNNEEKVTNRFQLMMPSSLPTTPTVSYAERTNSGNICLLFKVGHLTHDIRKEKKTAVSLQLLTETDSLFSTNVNYMYQIIGSKASCLNNLINKLGQEIVAKYHLEDVKSFNKTIGSKCCIYGRICVDSRGKLNPNSVLLEGSIEMTRGYTISLNLDKVPSYSIFPGQVVAVQGNNLNGNIFAVEQMFVNASLDFFKEKPTVSETIRIVVSSGPFTLRSNLAYEPLEDLLKHIRERKPDVAIFIGPFIDECNEIITEGNLMESFSTIFDNLVDNIMTQLKEADIQVVLVASQKDLHHHEVYPTPPYNLKKRYTNLHCMPDPSMLNIDGVIIGVTSADILMHLGKEEFTYSSQGGDRMGRITTHLLNQRSFYPLYPPDREMCIDVQLFEKRAIFKVTPHILILPSNLHYFVKNIDGCIVINPERLSKGYVGGTFAQLEILPKNVGSLCEDIICEIVQI